MKIGLPQRLCLLVVGLVAAGGSVLAQQFEVDVKFIETRGWDRLAAGNEDWSTLANQAGVRVLATPAIITWNGQRSGVRLDSSMTPGAGVRALVTPTVGRGGIRLEGFAAVTVQSGYGSRRAGAKLPVDTATSAFNRVVQPGQFATVHLGRRWETQTVDDRRSRAGRTYRENVPFDYYICLSVIRVASR